MGEQAGVDVVRFSGFCFDRRRGLLARQNDDSNLVPVAVGSRALDILGLLIDRNEEVVSRDDILNTVWPGVVEGANVTVQISALRRVLDEGRSEPSLIQTVPGRGYRFVAPVTRSEPELRPLTPPAAADTDRAAHGFGATPVAPTPTLPIAESGRRRVAFLATTAAFVVTLVLAVGAWRLWMIERTSATQQVVAATSIMPFVAPRLSILVLPFANLSNDPEQQYFADGITENVTTDLSRIAHSFVISRNTAFTYRNKPVDTKQIGRELGVRYVLEGSVQRSGNRVRINAQLIDAETDKYLWTDRFDRDLGDFFALQNEITGRIANALNLELVGVEAAKPTDHPESLDYIFRGRAANNKGSSREAYAEAIDYYERALVLDPSSVEAQSLLAATLGNRLVERKTDTAAADLEHAEGLIERALATSPHDPLAHYAKGVLLRAQNRPEEAMPEFETVLAFDPNSTSALHLLG
ncbi:MAG TPA: winged helix-turn-helix domain-containing tetratricopeptide repeat protein [Stellaceae bacterium]|nr:winged helix-turn-helix domain-containing tetratricopeptide repeat protein [Stellaceae bacterium]